QDNLQNQVSNETFLISYSLAQTVPGPMFTIATYLGADILKDNSFLGAIIATFGIFLGGFLLILAFYKSYESLSQNKILAKTIMAINACVVALLFSTLVKNIIPSAIFSIYDILLLFIGFILIRYMKINIFYIIFGYILFFLIKNFFV
ncbi:MAG TPA: chromate transporter, partial [Aliarcobacter thereius]